MNTENIYELIIIGGGPAGCGGAIYAARKRIKTLMILNAWGGQSIVSNDIQNWIGTTHISGNDLAQNLKAHVLEYKENNLKIKENHLVKNIYKFKENIFEIELENSSEKFLAKSILISTGSQRKKLNIKGADIFEHKGLTYCASCDGPLFAETDVIVIGGGNSAFESAAQLLAYTKSVTLICRGEINADKIIVDKLSENKKFKIIKNVIPKEVTGEKFVTGFTYTDNITKKDIELKTSAIFVEIGHTPATDFAKNVCDISPDKKIKINPLTQQTSQQGIWAAGDCTNVLYHQNNIAAGDAVKAIEDIYQYLKSR